MLVDVEAVRTVIPADLRALPQWVNWRYEPDDKGAMTKVPYTPSGMKASTTNATTWNSIEKVVRKAQTFDGIGFVFSADDPYIGTDLDHCRDPKTGVIEPWAMEEIRRVNSYSEISPSGTGIHIVAVGDIPRGKKTTRNGHTIEMYPDGRYFTMTGEHLEGTPLTVENRPAELGQLYQRWFVEDDAPAREPRTAPLFEAGDREIIGQASNYDPKFASLWRGETSAYNHDDSSADLALCDMLAYWTGGDGSRVDRLFRQSGLMRDKWDERRGQVTYGERTILKALASSYTPPRFGINTEKIEATNDGEIKVRPRYTIRTLRQAFEEQTEPEWIIDGLIISGSLVVLNGPPGAFKTWAVIDLAFSIARGTPWLNFPTKAGKVLIIDEESGQRRLDDRLQRVTRGHQADLDDPIEYVSLAGFNLREPRDIALLESLIDERQPSMVIIDALADIMPGADENSVQDVQPVMMALRQIAERTKATIILIHHNNKLGAYRGTTAIAGAVDLMLQVSSAEGSTTIDFKSTKTRDIEPVRFSATFVHDDVRLAARLVATGEPTERKRSPSQAYVLRYLKEHGPSLVTEITAHADVCSPTTAKIALYALATEGVIRRSDNGSTGKGATYVLSG